VALQSLPEIGTLPSVKIFVELTVGHSAKNHFAECRTRQRKTLGKEGFAECQTLGKEPFYRVLGSWQRLVLGKEGH